MAELKSQAATSNDFDFCWNVYSGTVKPFMAPQIRGGWQDAQERDRFSTIWFANRSHLMLLNGQPVGWFSYTEHNDKVMVDHFYIAEEHQRKKIGSILLNYICDEASKKGKPVVLQVLKGSGVKAFFEKMKFTESGKDQPITVEMTRSI